MSSSHKIEISFWDFSAGQDMMESSLRSRDVEAIAERLRDELSKYVMVDVVFNHDLVAIALLDVDVPDGFDPGYLTALSETYPDMMFEEKTFDQAGEEHVRNATRGFVGSATYDLEKGWDLSRLKNSEGIKLDFSPVCAAGDEAPSI